METQKSYYITTEKMSVGYDGKPLIEEVEIMLRKGEILTLLGPNGAGKSTILKSIARQLSLIAGTVRLDGEDMRTLTGAELSKKMAVVMTKRLRGELMTCEDVVATGRYPYTGCFGVLSKDDHKAVENAMELVKVTELRDLMFDRQGTVPGRGYSDPGRAYFVSGCTSQTGIFIHPAKAVQRKAADGDPVLT